MLDVFGHFQLIFGIADVISLSSADLYRLIFGQLAVLQARRHLATLGSSIISILGALFLQTVLRREGCVLFPSLVLGHLVSQLLHVLQVFLEDLHFVELV